MTRLTVQVVQHMQMGGIEAMALELQRFARDGHQVHIVSLEGSAPTALAAWSRLQPVADRLHFLDKPAGLRPGTVVQLVRLLRSLRPDAVHTHHIGPLLYGGIAARLAGVKHLVHTEHDAWHLADARRRRLQSMLTRLVRPTLVADAALVREAAEAALPGRQFQVITNGIDTERFCPADRLQARRQLGLPETVRLVGCAARLEEVKGHKVLLDALAMLPDDVHLALAGQGSLAADLAQQATSLAISGRIHFLGNVEAMPDFYNALDLFCLPSFREGLPLSPLEAQACGVRCVLTEVGGTREAICPQTGVLVPSGDPARLAAAISEQLADETAISPRQFVVTHGDVRVMTRSYEALYGIDA